MSFIDKIERGSLVDRFTALAKTVAEKDTVILSLIAGVSNTDSDTTIGISSPEFYINNGASEEEALIQSIEAVLHEAAHIKFTGKFDQKCMTSIRNSAIADGYDFSTLYHITNLIEDIRVNKLMRLLRPGFAFYITQSLNIQFEGKDLDTLKKSVNGVPSKYAVAWFIYYESNNNTLKKYAVSRVDSTIWEQSLDIIDKSLKEHDVHNMFDYGKQLYDLLDIPHFTKTKEKKPRLIKPTDPESGVSVDPEDKDTTDSTDVNMEKDDIEDSDIEDTSEEEDEEEEEEDEEDDGIEYVDYVNSSDLDDEIVEELLEDVNREEESRKGDITDVEDFTFKDPLGITKPPVASKVVPPVALPTPYVQYKHSGLPKCKLVDKLATTDIHEGCGIIYKPKTTTISAWDIVPTPQLNAFAQKVKYLFEGTKTYNVHKTNAGKLNTPSAWRTTVEDVDVFIKKNSTVVGGTAMHVLVDMSGSMAGFKMGAAVTAVQYLAHTAKTYNIPCRIVGFNNFIGAGVLLSEIKDWDDKEVSLANMKASDNNRDGLALRIAGLELLQRPETNKLQILISDGLPSACVKYGTIESLGLKPGHAFMPQYYISILSEPDKFTTTEKIIVNDIRTAIKTSKSQGIKFCSLFITSSTAAYTHASGMGHYLDTFKALYGNDLKIIATADLTKVLPMQLIKVLAQYKNA